THPPSPRGAMAAVRTEAMAALGHVRFRLAGHARGGRVAYRLALDQPGRLERLAVLDIVPTWAMWHRMDARLATRAWHWMFLALSAPFPETMIGKEARYYFDARAAAGTKSKSLSAFDPRALAHYHAFFNDPVRIHATCEDYRAGRTTDLAHDEETRASGQKITCPLLAIWGAAGGIPAETEGPLATWREWATCAALPSTAGIISPRRRRTRRQRRCSGFSLWTANGPFVAAPRRTERTVRYFGGSLGAPGAAAGAGAFGAALPDEVAASHRQASARRERIFETLPRLNDASFGASWLSYIRTK